MTPGAIREGFFSACCRTPEVGGFCADGRAMRVDTLEDGAGLQRGIPVTSCADFGG